ncbi:hypothetical protein HY333_00375 [Candidatus Collierbacteria bacterium]|nr:hypothetical protein [Candidatus Collierbacteria bacterium]
MPKLISILPLGLLSLSLVFSPIALAADNSADNLPDPSSKLFGLKQAISRVSENFAMFVERSEEKKAELELRYAEREARLVEKIEQLSESKPELAEKLKQRLARLQDSHQRRLLRLDQRLDRIGKRQEEIKQNLTEKIEESNIETKPSVKAVQTVRSKVTPTPTRISVSQKMIQEQLKRQEAYRKQMETQRKVQEALKRQRQLQEQMKKSQMMSKKYQTEKQNKTGKSRAR